VKQTAFTYEDGQIEDLWKILIGCFFKVYYYRVYLQVGTVCVYRKCNCNVYVDEKLNNGFVDKYAVALYEEIRKNK